MVLPVFRVKVSFLLFFIDRVTFRLSHRFERRHQLPGDRSGLAGPDCPPVNPGDRGNFGSGAGTDHLIRGIEIEVPDVLLLHGDPQGFCKFKQDHAGDAPEIVKGRGCNNLAVFHDVEVVARTFRYVAIRVKENRLIASLVICLNLR